MIITNESRIQKTYVVSNFRKPRQYLASISVRHSDMKAVGSITAAMQQWLKECPGIDHNLPFFVGLASLDNQACNLTVLVSFLLLAAALDQFSWSSSHACWCSVKLVSGHIFWDLKGITEAPHRRAFWWSFVYSSILEPTTCLSMA